MKNHSVIAIILFALIASGCAFPAGLAPTASFSPTQTPVIWTVTPNPPTETPTPTTTPTITPTVTQQIFVPVTTNVTVDSLNMREGPSAIFPIVARIQKDNELLVLGTARGGDWLFVRIQNNYSGWVASDFLFLDLDALNLPVYDFKGGYVLTGRIVDNLEKPVPGVNLAVTQGMPPNEARTDVYTDSTGSFFAFLPLSASGPWTIAIVGVKCTSPIMDAQCNFSGYFTNEAYTIMVPEDVSLPLVFQYSP